MVYEYTVILSVFLTVFLYAGAVRHTEHGEPLRWPTGLVSLPGRCVGSPSVGYTRYDAAAVLNEALLPLNPPGTAAPGGRPYL